MRLPALHVARVRPGGLCGLPAAAGRRVRASPPDPSPTFGQRSSEGCRALSPGT